MRALVLSGGGAKGAFQAGVLRRLELCERKYDFIIGTSVGAVNGAGFAYHGADALINFWSSIRARSDILRLQLTAPFQSGIYSMSPIRKMLCKNLSGLPSIPYAVCVYDMRLGRIEYKDSRDYATERMLEWIEASAAIPGIMNIVGDRYADGGIMEQVPVREALRRGATSLTIISCSPLRRDPEAPWKTRFPRPLTNALRAITSMEHDVFLHDLAACPKDAEVFAPETPVCDTLEFDPAKLERGIHAGLGALPVNVWEALESC